VLRCERCLEGGLIALVNLMAGWLDKLAQGSAASLRQLAELVDRDVAEISRTLPFAFLSPEMTEAILEDTQSPHLTAWGMKRIGELPPLWREQRHRLSYRSA